MKNGVWCFLCAVFFFFTSVAHAAELTPIPDVKDGPVIDQTATISPADEAELEAKILKYQDKTGHQIGVLIIPKLIGETLEGCATRVFETWKLGSKDRDDGLLLLVAKNDRKMKIEVGYGLEPAIPDIMAGRIIRNTLAPHFKKGEFYQGINAAVEEMMAAASQEAVEKTEQPAPEAAAYQTEAEKGAYQFGYELGSSIREYGWLIIGGIMVFMLISYVAAAMSVVSGMSSRPRRRKENSNEEDDNSYVPPTYKLPTYTPPSQTNWGGHTGRSSSSTRTPMPGSHKTRSSSARKSTSSSGSDLFSGGGSIFSSGSKKWGGGGGGNNSSGGGFSGGGGSSGGGGASGGW